MRSIEGQTKVNDSTLATLSERVIFPLTTTTRSYASHTHECETITITTTNIKRMKRLKVRNVAGWPQQLAYTNYSGSRLRFSKTYFLAVSQSMMENGTPFVAYGQVIMGGTEFTKMEFWLSIKKATQNI